MKILLILVGVGIFLGVLTYLTVGQKQHRVEVCVEFQGQKNCRIASGQTKDGALRTATDNACATITNGMTESMACGHNPPVSVKWLN
jgi:hypothetical protein